MSTVVAQALRVVLRDHGWHVADRPERVRALLSDLLGPSAREHRAEVDAIVVAAEEGIPALLQTEGPVEVATTEALRRLHERGLDRATSTMSLVTWGDTLEVSTSTMSTAPSQGPTSDAASPLRAGGTLSPSSDPDSPLPQTELPGGPLQQTRPPEPDASTNRPSRLPHLPTGGALRYAAAAVGTLALVAGVVALQGAWPDGVGDKGTPAAAGDGVAGGTLRLYSTAALTWDPMATTDPGLRLVMNRMLNRGLESFATSTGDKPAELVPDLATTTGSTDDGGQNWQFTLRPGALWEDGTPVVCADFRAGVARALANAEHLGYSYEATTLLDLELDPDGLPVLTGGPGAAADRVITCPDDRTVTMRLREARLDFPRYLALPELAPYREGPEVAGVGRRWMSNGPYVVDLAKTSETIGRLERNAHWNKATDPLRTARPDRVEITTAMKEDRIVDLLAAGQGDDRTAASLSPLPARSATQELADAGDRTQVAPNGIVEVLAPNFRRPAMLDVRLRQALQRSADRAGYCAAYGGNASRIEQRTLVGLHDSRTPAPDDDALDQYVAGQGASGVVIAYHSTPQDDMAMKALAAGWTRTGFAVTLRPFKGDKGAYYQHVNSAAGLAAYDLVRYDLVTSFDPVEETAPFDSRWNSGQATQGFADTEVQTRRDRARTTEDARARASAWDDVRRRATDQVALLPLAARVAFVAHGAGLRGVHTLNEFGGVIDPLAISIIPTPKEAS